jgi:aldehyde dehydrogenase (NAD+)
LARCSPSGVVIDHPAFDCGPPGDLSALVAGDTVIWKPSPETPAISAAFTKVFEEAGLPPGVFNLLLAPGAEVAKVLVSHPGVRVISFTGSTQTGRAIAESAARLNKKLSLEMGGKNAIIVLDDADIDLVTDATLWAAFGTTGQRCTAASRLIVQKRLARKVKESLVEGTKTLRLGNGLDEDVQIGPVINKAALERIHNYVQIGQKEGARLLIGGSPASVSIRESVTESVSRSAASVPVRESVSESVSKGFFYSPTLFDGVRPGSTLAESLRAYFRSSRSVARKPWKSITVRSMAYLHPSSPRM